MKNKNILTGFNAIDTKFKGFKEPGLTVIGGFQGTGTTSFIFSLASTVANNKSKAGIISCQHNIDQMSTRVHADAKGEVDLVHLPIGTINDVIDQVYFLAEPGESQIIFIDFLELIDTGANNNRFSAIEEILRMLKRAAMDLSIPIVVVSKLKPYNPKRLGYEGMKPNMDDLNSGVASIADNVCLLFNPLHHSITDDEYGNSLIGMAELMFLKTQYGRFQIRVRYQEELGKFSELPDSYNKDFMPTNVADFGDAMWPGENDNI